MLRALIWDVDGTLAETERDGHRVAFNAAFDEARLPWHWDVPTYGDLLRTAGGYERLMRFLSTRDDAPASEVERSNLARELHRAKNVHYERLVRDRGIPLRPGVRRLIDACTDAGVALALATTTSRRNVDALLTAHLGPTWPDRFGAVVCAEEAPRKKPDPSAYRIACDRMRIEPDQVLAVEDSPSGLAAANALGIATLITRSVYFKDDDFASAAAVCDGLDSACAWTSGSAMQVDLDVARVLVDRSVRGDRGIF